MDYRIQSVRTRPTADLRMIMFDYDDADSFL